MSTDNQKSQFNSCEVDVPVTKAYQYQQSEAGVKLLKANQKRYHLNIKSITSGGINRDDGGHHYASLYVRYRNQ